MTKVIFKKTPKDNEIIAFFPDDYDSTSGLMGSYMHVGQHSDACIEFYHNCQKAKPEEYRALYDELTNIVGYDDLVIRQRMQY